MELELVLEYRLPCWLLYEIVYTTGSKYEKRLSSFNELCNVAAFPASRLNLRHHRQSALKINSYDAFTMNEIDAVEEQAVKIPILLLKTKSTPHDMYEEYFSTVKEGNQQLAFDPVFVPVLKHGFRKGALDTVRGLLQRGQISKSEGAKYGGLIFTSQRAVEAFAKAVEGEDGILSYLCGFFQSLKLIVSIRLQELPFGYGGIAPSRKGSNLYRWPCHISSAEIDPTITS